MSRKEEVVFTILFLVFLAMMSVVIVACGTMGPSLNDQAETLAVAEAQYTAVLRTATDLGRRDMLDHEQIRRLDSLFIRAGQVLDTAWDAYYAEQAGRESKSSVTGSLDAFREILMSIRDAIQAREKPAEEGVTDG